jgi:hypothetical protein
MMKRGHEQEGGFKVKGICPDHIWYAAGLYKQPDIVISDLDRTENPANHLVALLDIFNDVVNYNRAVNGFSNIVGKPKEPPPHSNGLQQHPATPDWDEQTYSELEAKLSRWIMKAPVEMSPTPSDERILTMLKRSDGVHNWPHLHGVLTYHRCICMMNYGRLSAFLKFLEEGRPISGEEGRKGWKAYGIARSSALLVANINELIWSNQVDISWCTGVLLFATFHSLLILAILEGRTGRKCVMSSEPPSKCNSIFKQHQQAVAANFQTMKAISYHWSFAKNMLKTIDAVLASIDDKAIASSNLQQLQQSLLKQHRPQRGSEQQQHQGDPLDSQYEQRGELPHIEYTSLDANRPDWHKSQEQNILNALSGVKADPSPPHLAMLINAIHEKDDLDSKASVV